MHNLQLPTLQIVQRSTSSRVGSKDLAVSKAWAASGYLTISKQALPIWHMVQAVSRCSWGRFLKTARASYTDHSQPLDPPEIVRCLAWRPLAVAVFSAPVIESEWTKGIYAMILVFGRKVLTYKGICGGAIKKDAGGNKCRRQPSRRDIESELYTGMIRPLAKQMHTIPLGSSQTAMTR